MSNGKRLANSNGLRLVGWAYGAVTIVVALVALVVVSAQINTPVEASDGSDVTLARLSK